MKMKNRNEFLEELALLCEKYKAHFRYSKDDCGIEAYINGRDWIEIGHMDFDDAPQIIRAAKNSYNEEVELEDGERLSMSVIGLKRDMERALDNAKCAQSKFLNGNTIDKQE